MNKVTLQLDENVLRKLNSLVQGTDQTPEEFISALVNKLSSDQTEDEALLAECEARWDEFEKMRLAVPLDEIIGWVESWGTENRVAIPQCRKF
ncbi:hypothetical protein C4J81_18950 (plasmid) [Deltaproteobacteria bacterium Smac51]|nr:hypothetical protein C4J81_18950 [Deltaproteobacteria bacterium Smac51]